MHGKMLFALAGPALLALALAGCSVPQSAPGGVGDAGTATPPPARLSNPAIAPRLASIARQVRAAASASAAAALSNRLVHVNAQRQIQVYIHVRRLAAGVKEALAEAGATDILASKPLGLYQAWASPGALARIATLKVVTRITPPVYASYRGG